MHQQRKFRIAVSILVCCLLQAQGADKYTDENRPYEFGFNVEIDGSKQQHRHEKKDKDGIIMGEFGFVTADDVYHVTVYATDKEGRFKILSMKNIHLKSSPAPASPALSARQGHSLALPASVSGPASPAPPQAIPVSKPQIPFKPISLQPPGRSCSSCSIPTTTARAPPLVPPVNSPASAALPDNVLPGGFGSQPYNPQVGSPGTQTYPQQPGQPQQNTRSSSNIPNNFGQSGPSVSFGQSSPQNFLGQSPVENYPQPDGQQYPGGPSNPQPGDQQYPNVPSYPQPDSQRYPGGPSYPQPDSQQYPSGLSQPQPGGQQYPGGSSYAQSGSQQPSGGPTPDQNSYPQGGSPGRTSKQYTGPEQQFGSNLGPNGPGQVQGSQPGLVKPTLVTAQMQIVDKNTDINALRPGETKGLPPGLSKNDMSQLLYTFNYTVGFHGHFEEGYTNGFKKGYYFVTGRNGVKTRIDYEADDTGFHPRVSQEVLDLLSDDVPKPETEKEDKYGLKGYEFKWLYYPIESKSR